MNRRHHQHLSLIHIYKRDNESNVHYEYNGKSKYLSIGKLNNNAYLVIAAPESEIFADAIVLRQRITLFAEMTAIVVFIIGLLLIKTIEKQTSIDPVSYTHLDVYKRQVLYKRYNSLL